MKIIKVFALFLLSFLALNSYIFAAEITDENDPTLLNDLNLDRVPYSWRTAIGGRAITRPTRASYGWVAMLDGNTATAITENGNIFWQKRVPAESTTLISIDADDFVAIPLVNQKLCLLNHSGNILWTNDFSFDALFPPFFGRDGRIFVFGQKEIACFGRNGIRKWVMQTEPLSTEICPVELNDGSLLVFHESRGNDKTTASRLTPFGEHIENITFSRHVVNATYNKNGVIVAFSDGTIGMSSVDSENNRLEWLIGDFEFNQGMQFVQLDEPFVIAAVSPSSSGTNVYIINTAKGIEKEERLISSFCAGEIRDFNYVTNSPNGIFISNNNFGVVYATDSKRIRGITLPKKNKGFDYALYGSNGMAVFISSSWNIRAWRILFASKKGDGQRKNPPNYNELYQKEAQVFNFEKVREAADIERRTELQNGDYAAEEKNYWLSSNLIMEDYLAPKTRIISNGKEEPYEFSFLEQKSVISMLELFGTSDAAYTLSRIILLENDKTILREALKTVQKNGYDPNFHIINAIEALIKNTSYVNEDIFTECCDTIYSICNFMGRKSFFRKGASILSNLLLPQYSDSTKENVRKIYEQLVKLDL